MQGVTTEVIGNCGFSPAPVKEQNFELVKEHFSSIFPEALGITRKWSSMREYLEHLERNGTAVNVASLVGHGTIRINVMRYEKRPQQKMSLP